MILQKKVWPFLFDIILTSHLFVGTVNSPGAGLHRCGFWHFRMPSCWGLPTSLLRMRVVPPEKLTCQWKLAIFQIGDTSFSNGCLFTIVILVFRAVPKKSLKTSCDCRCGFSTCSFFCGPSNHRFHDTICVL